MDPYRSVWVCMVPGDLFQGFLGPNPLKNINKIGFGVFGGGPPPLGPVGCLVAYVILTYLRESV